jgi:hypothetical protein
MTPYGSTSNTVNVFADKQTMTKVIQVGEDFRCVLKVSKGLVNDYMLYLSDSSGVGFTDANLPDFVK